MDYLALFLLYEALRVVRTFCTGKASKGMP
jgi:hypothetical protein